MKLTNTLGREKQEFTPIHAGKVGMYVCGPTVYQTASIGNFRAFIIGDILRRVLAFNGYEVKQVMNITDVGHLVGDGDEGEDKMMVSMKKEGKTAWEIAEFYTKQFLVDMQALNILPPNHMPKATEHIPEQIEMIQEIEANGFAYQISDGIYFDTSKLENYGELSGQSLDEKEEGARVVKNPEKKNPTDFALWKFSPEDEQRQMEWESPWGKGFPGWHIECSAMSSKYLDDPFDIHTGGEDHIHVHHPNEMAQMEASHGNKEANYWIHNAFLMVDGGKMSKSLGNTYTVDDLEEKGFDPLAFRYFLLGAHYRTPQNFTWEALEAAQNALNNLRDTVREWNEPSASDDLDRFQNIINNDLDLPGALAELWNVVNGDLDTSIKAAMLLKMDTVFGLGLESYVAKQLDAPIEVKDMLKARKEARESKDWTLSDTLRDEIQAAGFDVKDTADGQRLVEKR